MSVKFKDQYFTFNKILEENKDYSSNRRYYKVSLSSSYKKDDGSRKYSDWIARFTNEEVETLKKGDFIVCDGSFTREPYEREGKRVWGESSMNIFSFRLYEKQEISTPTSKIEEELPF